MKGAKALVGLTLMVEARRSISWLHTRNGNASARAYAR